MTLALANLFIRLTLQQKLVFFQQISSLLAESRDESISCALRGTVIGLDVLDQGELIFLGLLQELAGLFKSSLTPASIGMAGIGDVIEEMFVELDGLLSMISVASSC